jgi:hypothetical protein
MAPGFVCSPSAWNVAVSSGRRSSGRCRTDPSTVALLIEAMDWRRSGPDPPRRCRFDAIIAAFPGFLLGRKAGLLSGSVSPDDLELLDPAELRAFAAAMRARLAASERRWKPNGRPMKRPANSSRRPRTRLS